MAKSAKLNKNYVNNYTAKCTHETVNHLKIYKRRTNLYYACVCMCVCVCVRVCVCVCVCMSVCTST